MKSLASFVFLFSFAGATLAGDWPNWRGPNHDGISTETGWRSDWLDDDPEITWKAGVGTGYSGMSVAAGRLYTLGNERNKDTIYGLDAETGDEIWTHTYECKLDPKFYEGGPSSTPTVDGDTVYSVSKDGHLFALDAASGEVRWAKQLTDDFGLPRPDWGFAGSALVAGDLLVVNAGAAGLALKKSDGSLAWKSDEKDAGYSTPRPAGRQVFVSSERDFSGVDLASGEALWTHKWLTRFGINAADPIPVGENRVFISSGYNKGCALLEIGAGAPTVVWQNRDMRNQMNPCVKIGDHLYGVDGNQDDDPALKCLEIATGKVLWEDDTTGAGGVMAADGKLIIISDRGELVIAPASPGGFEPTCQVQVLGGTSWTVPTLANGRIYGRNADGDVVCIDVRK